MIYCLDSVQGTVKMGSRSFRWNNWGDVLTASNGTDVWASYTDQFYAGRPAVIHRKFGKGTVTYVGPDSDDGALEKAVLQKVYATAGIGVKDYPDGVVVDWRDGFWVAVNYSGRPYTVKMAAKAKVLVGSATVSTAGVVVWRE